MGQRMAREYGEADTVDRNAFDWFEYDWIKWNRTESVPVNPRFQITRRARRLLGNETGQESRPPFGPGTEPEPGSGTGSEGYLLPLHEEYVGQNYLLGYRTYLPTELIDYDGMRWDGRDGVGGDGTGAVGL